MRVALVDQKGPIVNGNFALATEIHDDSGAPHTLEHLCFMGSKSFRYKGFLDKLATRQYSMTNAGTDTDRTIYELVTAGWEAFANMLPVYLDHLIVPTLTDAACYTEVHHIDGSGNDAGVVYSEMQGVQNTSPELMELALKRSMYPEYNGFRYETGGMMEQLRTLTAGRIRQFHKEMYQPKNMRLVITGEVDHDELLRILEGFEDAILQEVPPPDAPFNRPWIETGHAPELTGSVLKKVQFPEEDESMGEIVVSFFGPDYSDHLAQEALAILLQYLCGSPVTVLRNTLVEKEQLCSMVTWNCDYRPETLVRFELSAVETERLEEVEARLIQLLKQVAAEPLDTGYMRDIIERSIRQAKSRAETSVDFFSESIIEDHLFGRRTGEDLERMRDMKRLESLLEWTDAQWRDLMSTWLVNAHHVSILAVPSHELSEKISHDEKARVKEQQERLGEEGLKKLAEKLKEAHKANDKPIPEELLAKFEIPGTDSIHFIETVSARGGAARQAKKLDNRIQNIVDKDDDGSPLFIHFEHIQSNFVHVKVDLCTGAVPVELKPLITLYVHNFFTTPVARNGNRVEFEDVVLDLERETVDYGAGFERDNSEILSMAFNTEPQRYESIIAWIRTLFYDAINDEQRLHATLTKILAEIPDAKRDGDEMVYDVMTMIHNEPSSTIRAQAVLTRALYLKRTRQLLRLDPAAVLKKFATLCSILQRPENLRVYVAGNLERLPKPISAWKHLTEGLEVGKPLTPLDSRKKHLSQTGLNPGNTAYIVPMKTLDSSHALLATKGPESYEHPDLPALMVATAYMDAVEGPLWRAVRGNGLAYGTGWTHKVDTGMLTLLIYRSPDTHKAWKACKEQTEGLATGKLPFDKLMLEGAISEIVLHMAREQPNMASAASASFINQVLRGIDKEWNHQILAQVRAVTAEQVKEVMTKYMVPVFRPESSNVFITCAQIMREGLETNFLKDGFLPRIERLEFFQDDYGLEAPEGEEDVDEDDEFDDDDEGEDDENEDEAIDTPASEEDEQ
jgi:Zn-dependent M16 (insulinase) family peptidase